MSAGGIPDAELRLALAQTVAWCAGRDIETDYADGLRSMELAAESLTRLPTFEERRVAVDGVAERRVRLLRSGGLYALRAARSTTAGRLLLYDPDATEYDSTALVESYGFFDWDNQPPWDTWLAYVRDASRKGEVSHAAYLIAWVPPQLVGLAEAAVAASPERALLWVDDLDTPLARRIAARGAGGGEAGWRRLAPRRILDRFGRRAPRPSAPPNGRPE